MVPAPIVRNLFEIENARNLLSTELASTFVSTQDFWRLLSPKNQIVLGTRGSGKTALARVLSHDVLGLVEDDRAAKMVRDKSYIGIFLSARQEWPALEKRAASEDYRANGFLWRFNIALAQASLVTLRSCLRTYLSDAGERADAELRIARELGDYWLPETFQKVDTLRQLSSSLESLEFERLVAEARAKVNRNNMAEMAMPAAELEAEPFSPVRQVMHTARKAFEFTDHTSWFVVVDEAELLTSSQWRMLNTQMRGAPRGLFLKITTMPFHHPTTETDAGVPANQGHDFEYIWIGRPAQREGNLASRSPGDRRREDVGALEFANKLFAKRAAQSTGRFHGVTLKGLLGKDSGLLSANEDGNRKSPRENYLLIKRYGSSETAARADRLLKEKRVVDFRNQVWRKMKGAVELRVAFGKRQGRASEAIYYGENVVVRIGDNNPRRLIRIFNRLLLAANRKPLDRGAPLSRNVQERELINLSASEVSWVRSEKEVGPELYQLVLPVGRFLEYHLHEAPLTTDQVGAFRYDLPSNDPHWQAVARGFGVGIICQHDGAEGFPKPDDAFRLSFVLAPYFRLIPRRGKVRSLKSILEWANAHSDVITRLPEHIPDANTASAYSND